MYSSESHHTGRKKFHKTFTFLSCRIHPQFYYCYLKALTTGFCLLFLPTVINGCSKSVDFTEEGASHTISLTINSFSPPFKEGNALDILVFNDDRLQRLDSYQKIEEFSGNLVQAASTDGQKIFFLYYGPFKQIYEWADIYTYSSLRQIICCLESEDRNNLAMTGCCRFDAGNRQAAATLTPLASEVRLNSLKCDFRDTPYSGARISEAKAYLINVNAASCIIPDYAPSCSRVINAGTLNSDDMNKFKDRSLVLHIFDKTIGTDTAYPDNSFFCYQNNGSAGIRTKLVIEGIIDGVRYYWPIHVGGDEGVLRNMSYNYNILIRRKGVTDPDSIIDPKDMEIDLKIKSWKEKENYAVRF